MRLSIILIILVIILTSYNPLATTSNAFNNETDLSENKHIANVNKVLENAESDLKDFINRKWLNENIKGECKVSIVLLKDDEELIGIGSPNIYAIMDYGEYSSDIILGNIGIQDDLLNVHFYFDCPAKISGTTVKDVEKIPIFLAHEVWKSGYYEGDDSADPTGTYLITKNYGIIMVLILDNFRQDIVKTFSVEIDENGNLIIN